jgi:tryptophan synthase beta chain
VAEAIQMAPRMAAKEILVVNLSGRGDKDMGIISRELHL